MQFAILAGVYSPPANSSVSTDVTCSTGNCTFPVPFTTLDMCHSCSDISNQVMKLEHNTWLLPGYGSMIRTNYSDWYGMHLVNMTTSKNITGPEKPRTSLFDFQILAVKCNGSDDCRDDGKGTTHAGIAFECSLTPCVRTYMANMTNHVYAEHEVISRRQFLHPSVNPVVGFNVLKYFQLGVNRTFYNGNWIDCNASKNKTETHTTDIFSYKSYTEYLHENSTYREDPLYYRPECTFQVGHDEVYTMRAFADNLFSKATVLLPYRLSLFGEAWIQKLWDWGRMDFSTVDAFAKGLATSIGANWRRNPETLGIEYVEGYTHLTEPCIKVSWGFLFFLAILVIAESLFLVIIVIISHRSPWKGDWKSSILPYLFQKITLPNLTDKQTESDLKKAAEGVRATFEPVDGRWTLTTG